MSQFEKPKKIGFQCKEDKIFPPMVVLSTSNTCNSNCVNCWFRHNNLRKREGNLFMPYEMLINIYKECREIEKRINKKIILRHTGTGEPFMSPLLFFALMDGIKMGLNLSVITNGSLVIPRMAKELLEAGIDMLEFSVDAGTKEEYEKTRVGLSFDTLVKNIDFILKYREKINNKKTKIIASIVNQKGIDFEKAMDFWKNKGLDDIMGRVWLTYGVLPKDNYAEKPYLDPKNRIACSYPFKRITILSNGNVTFCNYDVKPQPEQGFYMGNINSQSIQEIWQGDKFNQWRKLHLKGKWNKIPLCKNCDDWKYKPWLRTYQDQVRKKAETKRFKEIKG